MVKVHVHVLRAHAANLRDAAAGLRGTSDEIMSEHTGTETEKLASLQAAVISDAADLLCHAADSIEALTH